MCARYTGCVARKTAAHHGLLCPATHAFPANGGTTSFTFSSAATLHSSNTSPQNCALLSRDYCSLPSCRHWPPHGLPTPEEVGSSRLCCCRVPDGTAVLPTSRFARRLCPCNTCRCKCKLPQAAAPTAAAHTEQIYIPDPSYTTALFMRYQALAASTKWMPRSSGKAVR